jgi:hypothetical protein
MRLATRVMAFAVMLPCELPAQETVPLDAIQARISEPFSLLRGARELPDGRLLVTDWIEQRVAVIDFARDRVEDRGGLGAGPGEYRLPAGLLPFRGDSTLLVDVGNGRLTVIDANGRIGRSFQPRASPAGQPGGADRHGRLYFTVPAWMVERPLPDDTVELAVYDTDAHATRVLARVQGSRRPSSDHAPTPRVPYVVFAAQDTWTVDAEGRIAVVRDGGYRVQWIDGGRTVTGPSNDAARPRVTAADRTAFVRRFLLAAPMSGKGEDSGMVATPTEMLSRENVELVVRGSEFAETLPAFAAGDARIDRAGRLWVGLFARAGEPRRHDVFDAQGVRIARVQLRPDRHLIALGRAHVYVAHTDPDGLQTIERYAIPSVLDAR